MAIVDGNVSHEREPLSPPQAEDGLVIQSSPNLSRSYSSDPDCDAEPGVVLCDSVSLKTLFYLKSTLNACFPDYDFSSARGEDFCRELSPEAVLRMVDYKLSPIVEGYGGQLRLSLWTAIDKEIGPLRECSVYSYTPDYSSDPFSSDGAIWSFNYFFYNKRLKRFVFFACRALSKMASVGPDEYQTQWSMEVENASGSDE